MYTVIENGKPVAQSLGLFDYPNGMNENCLQAKEWTTRRGVSYRVEVHDYWHIKGQPICLCWTAYKLRWLSHSVGRWEKISCSTRAEENAFPHHVAMIGQHLVDGYGKTNPQLELAF